MIAKSRWLVNRILLFLPPNINLFGTRLSDFLFGRRVNGLFLWICCRGASNRLPNHRRFRRFEVLPELAGLLQRKVELLRPGSPRCRELGSSAPRLETPSQHPEQKQIR